MNTAEATTSERIFVTGASGFVGRAFCSHAQAQGRPLRAALRLGTTPFPAPVDSVAIGPIHGGTDWRAALTGCSAVLHLAARVHVMSDTASDPLLAFREVNTAGTLQLASQAAAAGVRRFVFVSSVKVNGEATALGRPFIPSDAPAPQDPYGISKAEAEAGLRQIAEDTGMEVAIVRPPLIYGPGVRANFAALVRALRRGVPLPLGSVTGNRRSLVALDNLVDLLLTCIDHPAAAGQTFLVSDDEDLSTTGLLRRLGQAVGRPARLVSVPPALLQLGATLVGKGDVAQRLLGNLQVDISHTRTTLSWSPPVTVDEGLRRAALPMVPR